MDVPQAGALMDLWSRGAGRSSTDRALLLLEIALPAMSDGERAHLPIGYRDAWLLSLRERLFGGEIECLARCAQCREEIAVDFRAGDVRADYAEPGHVVALEGEAGPLRLRLPDSTDLLAIERARDGQSAGMRLLQRLLVGEAPEGAPPSRATFEAASQALGEADPQAETRLAIACPGCGASADLPFDIATHLWSDLDDWAGALLDDVHRLAIGYGWSEAEILALSPPRRRAYLDRLERAA